MSPDADNTHSVRRVVLPSGKTIDVVYFDEHPEAVASRSALVPPATKDLHVCASCDSRLVYPLEWAEVDAAHWEVTLRCPNCEWMGTGVFSQEIVERFDEQLDRGTEALVRDLKRLMHANLEDEIERFATALEADHIVPDDF